jgi:stigma-specific protein Stig1
MRFPGRARALVFAVVASLVAGCPNGAGITCPSGQTLCNGSCTFVANDPQNCGVCGKACPGSLICISGSCGCPPEQLACADVCVDSKVDPNNCGDCGVSCVSGQLCSGGSCATTCGVNLTQCGNLCNDTMNDPMNCGMCGHACGVGELCCGGSCALIGTNEHCIGCMPCPPNGFCFTMGSGLGNMCGAG